MSDFTKALAVGVSLAALATHLYAAEESPDTDVPSQGASADAGTGLSEIVVTAQRRAESLQKVPVSITAVTGEALAEQHLQIAADLQGTIPNLQASYGGGSTIPIFSLRGVSMNSFGMAQQGPVATYFDEVYKGDFPLMSLDMYDLQRVEVLRGPQGTLYGKNTTGGAINFISNKPTFQNEGYLQVGYGNYDRVDADGAINVPIISDVLAGRIAFTYSHADGWFKNISPGYPNGNGVQQYGIRAQLLYKPTDKLDFTLKLSNSLVDPPTFGVYTVPGATGVGAGVYEAFGTGTSYFRPPGMDRRETDSSIFDQTHRTYGQELTANWHATDNLTVTSVSSYDFGNMFTPEDGDGSPLHVEHDYAAGRSYQFSQDLRLASSASGPFNYIIGGYYNRERNSGHAHYEYWSDLFGPATGQQAVNNCLLTLLYACNQDNHYSLVRESYAAYMDGNYKLNDVVTLRGGLRYTEDKANILYTAWLSAADGTPILNTIPGDPTNIFATTPRAFSAGKGTGKVGVDFNIADDKMIYVSISTGYRGGAFNDQGFSSLSELTIAGPETVTAYETGAKTQWFNRKLTLDGAVFYYDYHNQQVLNIDPITFHQTLINIPKSRIYGGELEIETRPVEPLRLHASIGLLNTKIQEGTVSGVDVTGNPLTAAPSATLAGGFDWDVLDNDRRRLTLSADSNYVSRQYYDLYKTQAISEGGYALLNGRITYAIPNSGLTFEVWGKNLLDKFYFRQSYALQTFGYNYYNLGEPRTFGASVKFKW